MGDEKPTKAEMMKRLYNERKASGLVYLPDPITPEQRTEFKSVLKGESKVVKNKKKGKDDANT
jgi:hypothetical protein